MAKEKEPGLEGPGFFLAATGLHSVFIRAGLFHQFSSLVNGLRRMLH
jgi:hypothetical protein